MTQQVEHKAVPWLVVGFRLYSHQKFSTYLTRVSLIYDDTDPALTPHLIHQTKPHFQQLIP